MAAEEEAATLVMTLASKSSENETYLVSREGDRNELAVAAKEEAAGIQRI